MKKTLIFSIIISGMVAASAWSQETELVINNGDIQIAGTLSEPQTETGKPLVILITGSGAQDRDETIIGFKPFKIIADHLTREGIPSFRYDDRSIGGSSGVFTDATLDDLASDVSAIMSHFEGTYDRFILLGHSQGGPVATKVVSKDERVNGIVFMAATMVPIKDVISEQIVVMQTMMGKTEADIAPTLEFQELAYETSRKDEGWDDLKMAYKELVELEISKLPAAQQAYIKDIDAFAEAQFNAQVTTTFRTPQMRSLLHYDPIPDLVASGVPSLAIFGEKDTQVTVDQNATVYEEVSQANGLDYSSVKFSEANHLFQPANTGMITEYATLPKEFVDGFLESISEWILLKY